VEADDRSPLIKRQKDDDDDDGLERVATELAPV